MLTGVLVFVILGIVFWLLSRFLGKIARGFKEAKRSDEYFKSALLENVQAIKEGVCPAPEAVDIIAEIGKINKELVVKESQRQKDRKAIENLINDSQDI